MKLYISKSLLGLLIVFMLTVSDSISPHPKTTHNIEDVTLLITTNRTDHHLYLQRALMYLEMMDWSAAVTDIKQARLLKPGDPLIHYHQALLHLGLQQPQQATKELLALTQKADNKEHNTIIMRAEILLGEIALEMNKPKAAAMHFNRVLDASSNPPANIFFITAKSHQKAGNINQALSITRLGLKSFPGYLPLADLQLQLNALLSNETH